MASCCLGGEATVTTEPSAARILEPSPYQWSEGKQEAYDGFLDINSFLVVPGIAYISVDAGDP